MKSLPLYDTILKAGTEAIFKSMNFTKLFIFLLVLGIILRLITALWSFNFRENTDVLRWRDWGRIAYLHGLSETYKTDHISFGTLPNNMPPGTLYVASSMYMANIYSNRLLLKLYDVEAGSFHWMNSSLPNGFLRIPSIAADIFTACLIYYFIKKRAGEKNALLGMSLFFFNPVVLYNSSFWGQMDSINNIFFFISLLLLLKKRVTFGLIAYFLSLYIKLSLLFTLPFVFLIVFLLLKRNIVKFLKSLIIAAGSLMVLTFPISNQPWIWIPNYLSKNAVGEMQNITAFALNFWWFVFKPTISIGKPLTTFEFSEIRLLNSPLSQQILGFISLEILAFSLFTLLTIPFFIFFLKNNLNKIEAKNLFLIFSLICLTAFLFLPRMHERYLFPMLPLLATYIGLSNKKYLLFFAVFSILNFINLYLVWHPMLPPLIPYHIMTNTTFQWALSTVTLFLFVFFYVQSIKTIYYHVS